MAGTSYLEDDGAHMKCCLKTPTVKKSFHNSTAAAPALSLDPINNSTPIAMTQAHENKNNDMKLPLHHQRHSLYSVAGNTSTPIMNYSHHIYNLEDQQSFQPFDEFNTSLFHPAPPPGIFDVKQQFTPHYTSAGINYPKIHQHLPYIQPADILDDEKLTNLPTQVKIPVVEQKHFPVTFDPRSAANMPHKEKVNEWITELPIYSIADGRLWYSGCYPGAVPASSSLSESANSVDELDISNYNKKILGIDSNCNEQLFIDRDDILEFQARKITRYVKKVYKMDQSESVVKGDRSLLGLHNFEKSHDYSLNDLDSNMEITNTSYNLNLTEAFEQINRNQLKSNDLRQLGQYYDDEDLEISDLVKYDPHHQAKNVTLHQNQNRGLYK